MNQKSFRLDKSKKEDKGLKIFLQLFLIFLIASGGIIFIYFAFAKKDRSSITFNERGEANYRVFLKDNNYYNSDYLEEGMSYIASLIDYISVDFNYSLNSNKQTDLEYKYDISAELVITERGQESKVLYRKSIQLKEETVEKATTKGNITESLEINYDTYNAMVNSYKKDYSLSVSSKLIITMHISSTGNAENIGNNAFKSSNDLVLSIPLSEQTLEINLTRNNINSSKEIIEYSSFNPINYINLFIGIILVILAFIFVIKVLWNLKNANKVSKYMKMKNNILKEYDRFIVEADKIKNASGNKNLVRVKSFNELLDARDNTDSPIIFYEDVMKCESTFMVIDGSSVYVYKIKQDDCDKE